MLETNAQIAGRLDEVARLLEAQGANRFRVEAYRRGAVTLRNLSRSVIDIIKTSGIDALEEIPTIGPTLARAIYHIATTGTLPMLDRIRGQSDPVTLIATVPGIGHYFAKKIHHDLGIDSLEDLEAAAYDGRLRNIEGMGEKRLAGIRDSLATRLGRVRKSSMNLEQSRPSVEVILSIDREYRTKAEKGLLTTIAPRRFNPQRVAWLPILHSSRGAWHFTALFSNTPRAHQMNKTHDWLVVYYDNENHEGQATIVTAYKGKLMGKRVVRGRENECEAYYDEQQRINLPTLEYASNR